MKQARVYVNTKDAIHLEAHLNDFAGSVEEWKDAVYQLFRLNMTWSFADVIDVRERRGHDVYVKIIAKPAYENNIKDAMDDLDFHNVLCKHEDIGWIECTDLPEDMLLDYVKVEY